MAGPCPVAIVGCGLIGQKRAASLPTGYEIVSVFDTDGARADALVATVAPGASIATSAHDAFSQARRHGGSGVGLAVIATLHRDLGSLAAFAIDAGLDVLVEKPGGRAAADLEGAVASARASGRTLRVGFNHRFHPALRRLFELVAGGEYGEVMWIRASYGHGGRVGYEREWRADRALSGGGELLDQGAHLIDLSRWVLGATTRGGELELAHASVRTSFWNIDVEDNAWLTLYGQGQVVVSLHVSWTEWKNRFCFEVACRTAHLAVEGLGGSYGPETLTVHAMSPEMGPPLTTTYTWPPGDDSWRQELVDVAAAEVGEPAIGATGDDALATLRIIESAYATSGRSSR